MCTCRHPQPVRGISPTAPKSPMAHLPLPATLFHSNQRSSLLLLLALSLFQLHDYYISRYVRSSLRRFEEQAFSSVFYHRVSVRPSIYCVHATHFHHHCVYYTPLASTICPSHLLYVPRVYHTPLASTTCPSRLLYDPRVYYTPLLSTIHIPIILASSLPFFQMRIYPVSTIHLSFPRLHYVPIHIYPIL